MFLSQSQTTLQHEETHMLRPVVRERGGRGEGREGEGRGREGGRRKGGRGREEGREGRKEK